MVLRLVTVGIMHVVAVAGALTYCSSQNTGSTSAQSYQYQSNGWCSLECKGYNYAIVQGYDCWCSDDAPGASTGVSDCDEPCPGYSYESCGSADAALFGYIYLGTGTASSLPTESSTAAAAASSSASLSSLSSGAAPSSTSVSLSTAASSPASSSLWSSSVASSSVASSSASSVASSSASSTSLAPASSSAASSSSSASPSASAYSSDPATAASASASTPSSPTPSSTSSPTPSSTSSPTPSSTSSSTTSPSTSSSPSPTTTTPSPTTTTPSPTTTTPSSTTPSSTTTSSTGSTTSSFSISNQLVTSVIYSVQTVTAAPSNSAATTQAFTTQVVTTVYSTPTSVPAVGSARSSHSSFWHSPGRVAGTFVAVGIVVLALLVLAVFFFMRRRRSRDEDFERRYNDVVAPVASASSLDTRSSSSPNGFVYADEKGIQGHPTPSQKNDASRVSQLTEDDLSVLQQQPDAPVVVDQRLDPRQMIMTQWENGGSRLSLADDVDYSRKVLRVINE